VDSPKQTRLKRSLYRYS